MSDKWSAVSTTTRPDKWSAVSTLDPPSQQPLPELLSLVPAGAARAPALPFGFGKRGAVPAGKLDLDPATTDRLIRALAIVQDDRGQRETVARILPSARFTQDAEGRTIVDIQGQRAYLNKPGMSGQDAVTGTTQGTVAALSAVGGGAAVARVLGRVPGFFGRALTTGAAVGAGSAGQDLAAHAMGAREAVNTGRTLTAAAFGAGGQVAVDALAPAVRMAYRWVTGNASLYDQATQKLTQAGIALLRRAGATAGEITDDLARQFAQQARTAAHPGEALRSAEGMSLPVPVRPTRGQITGSEKDLRIEQLGREGAFGEGAAGIMKSSRAGQQEALRANVPAIQGRMARGQPPVQPGQGAQAAQTQLVAQREAEKRGVDTAFDTARGTSAGVERPIAQRGVHNVRGAVAADHSLQGLPRTTQLLDELETLANVGGDDSAVMVRSLFDWRKRASSASRGALGSEEGLALSKAIKGFDQYINETVERGLLAGDETAVAAWQSAIKANREFAGKYKGGDMVEALTRRMPRGGQYALEVAPEDAANYIFSASNTGWIGKANAARDLTRVRELLGADSAAWNGLRQEAFLRLAQAGEGAMETSGARAFSGANFEKAWTSALTRNPQLMSVLFTPEERSLVSQFARVAARTTTDPRYSTAASASVLIQNIGGSLGSRVGKFLADLPFAKTVTQAARTFGATSRGKGKVTPRRGIPATPRRGFAGAITGAAGRKSEEIREKE